MGKNIINERYVQRWFNKFRSGDTNLQDKSSSGRSPAIDNDVLKSLIESNPRQTTRELAMILDVDNKTAYNHLRQIGKVKNWENGFPIN
jgi:[histone H3]-lysine36 N-dimethyltransferase SETMAR